MLSVQEISVQDIIEQFKEDLQLPKKNDCKGVLNHTSKEVCNCDTSIWNDEVGYFDSLDKMFSIMDKKKRRIE